MFFFLPIFLLFCYGLLTSDRGNLIAASLKDSCTELQSLSLLSMAAETSLGDHYASYTQGLEEELAALKEREAAWLEEKESLLNLHH